MEKARVIIADTDVNYILSLQQKFIEEFFEKIDLEIITDKEYLKQMFTKPQSAELLIVSEDLYDLSFQKHNIGTVFLMMEQYDENEMTDSSVNRIFKYTSINELFNEILGKGAEALRVENYAKKTQIVVVTSAAGGVGKTTVAMGLSACLAKNYKKVLYLNAEQLQTFQYMMQNAVPVTANEIYADITNQDEKIYHDIKYIIRKETFNYVPPFKASLMSLGIPVSFFKNLALGARDSNDYDYIVIDTDIVFDEEKAQLIDIADKVIVVTKQNRASVYATNLLVSNINGVNSDKYIFVCNDFNDEHSNALISPDIVKRFNIAEYVRHLSYYDQLKSNDLANEKDIQKIAVLVV